ncbi:MAG: hypothetical protein JWO69_368 [Thermoleophilia bacterium]|jgi:hypothetical protein|nr:hypothetical protein [Thermoleophilia bacterium]
MRGTLHVVAAEDLGWMCALSTPGVVHGVGRRWEQLGIDEAHLEAARGAAIEQLTGGGRATRHAFISALDAAGIDCSGQRGYHTIWYLSQTGTLCWGPLVGDQQALVLLDEWVPSPRRVAGDEAVAELARRYFAGHGPATIKDLAWWCKLPLKAVRAAHAEVEHELVEIDCDGASLWMSAEAFATLDPDDAAAKASVLLLPAFDEHLLGYQDRSLVLTDAHFERIVPGRNGMFKPTIVDGGRVVGTWTRTKRARKTIVQAQPFTKLPQRATRGFAKAAAAWGAFAGVDVEVDV